MLLICKEESTLFIFLGLFTQKFYKVSSGLAQNFAFSDNNAGWTDKILIRKGNCFDSSTAKFLKYCGSGHNTNSRFYFDRSFDSFDVVEFHYASDCNIVPFQDAVNP